MNRACLIIVLFACAVSVRAHGQAADWVRLQPDADNLQITESCVIPAGEYRIEDVDGNGVLHVEADDVIVVFERGAVLIGSRIEQSPDEYTGVGVRIDGASNVTIRGGEVRGASGTSPTA